MPRPRPAPDRSARAVEGSEPGTRDASAGEKLRLFVATDVAAWAVRDLDRAMAPYRERLPGFRWTDPGGWHVTLKFLGWVESPRRAEIERAMVSVAAETAPFQTSITRIGVFPAPGRARVLWAGLDDADGTFGRMVKRLDDLLVSVVRPEGRSFAPHLTLARIQPPARMRHVAPDLLTLDAASEPFAVDRMVLYRSRLSPAGARYEAVAAAPLLESAPGP
jgi:2'-5' RNA ligase